MIAAVQLCTFPLPSLPSSPPPSPLPLSSQDLCVPALDVHYICRVSEELATNEPQLTLEFLTEAIGSIQRADTQQKLFCLAYMSPWLLNLGRYIKPRFCQCPLLGAPPPPPSLGRLTPSLGYLPSSSCLAFPGLQSPRTMRTEMERN